MSSELARQGLVTKAIWLVLLGFALTGLIEGRWSIVFLALLTIVLSMVPVFVARYAGFKVPRSFIAAITIFVGGTLFLGEVHDFYERFWWWDIAMHGGSAIGFGLIGFVLIFIMFQGDAYAAPPIALAFFAFCFAIAIGAVWEVFEFAMDQIFGTNMQKNGLVDTMEDLVVDMIGAFLGAAAGFAYLKGVHHGGLQDVIDEMVKRNPRLFSKRWQQRVAEAEARAKEAEDEADREEARRKIAEAEAEARKHGGGGATGARDGTEADAADDRDEPPGHKA